MTNRPRLAIEAAKAVIKRDTENNRRAARNAADAAYAADAADARAEMMTKILSRGLELLNE